MSEELKRLLELAAKPLRKPLKKLEYGSNVFQFISEMDIRSSEADRIPFAIIYMKYYLWCENHGLQNLASNQFSKDFKKKFDKVAGASPVCFHISPAGFDLSPHNEQDAQLFLQEVTNRAKRKKDSKKAVKEIIKKKSSKPGPSKSDEES